VNVLKRWKVALASAFVPAAVLLVFWRPLYAIVVNALYDFVQIAAPANPAAGRSRLYADSTSHQLACLNSDGSSCMPAAGGGVTVPQMGVGLASLTDPAGFTWTSFNIGSATVTVNGATRVLNVPSSAGTNIRGQTTPVTGSSPYTVSIGFTTSLSRRDFGQCGLAITDGTKFITIRYPKNAGDLDLFTWTNSSTPSASIGSFTQPVINWAPYTFERIQEDSSNRIYSYSTDGVNYTTLVTEAKATFLTATAAGYFCLETAGTGNNAGMTVVHFTATAP
jgi:hypothetical protein